MWARFQVSGGALRRGRLPQRDRGAQETIAASERADGSPRSGATYGNVRRFHPGYDGHMPSSQHLSSRRWLVLASSVVSFFAVGVTFFAVPPLIPELVQRYGLNNFRVGLLMGAIAIPAILLSIPLGSAIDRWSARRTGLAGLLLMGLAGVLFATAPTYAVLLLARLLFGIGGLIMNLLLARLISTAFASRELSLAMGIFNAVYPASMIVIFTLHPRIMSALGWRGELMAFAALAFAATPLHMAAVPPSSRSIGPAGIPVSEPARPTLPLIALALSWMFFFGAFASVFTFAPQWAGGGSRGLLVVTAITWVSLLSNPLVGLAIDRTGHPALWGGTGQLFFAGILMAMALAVFSPLAAMLLVGITAATVPTAVYSLPSRLAPPSSVGFAFGFITAFSNLGTVLGPAAAGALRDRFASWTPVWLALAAMALAGAMAMVPVRARRQSPARLAPDP